MEKLTNIIESLLFVSGKEISLQDICEKLDVSINEARLAALELQQKYSGESGLLFLYFNDKIQFGSNPVYGEQVEAVLNPIRERELSRSMLETAAIIAYKQPITRGEIEELRGVNSDYAISNLQKLGLIEIIGKKDAIGRPSLFATTDKFLKRFQISSIEDLPSYDDIMEQGRILNTESEDTYLYKKDVYVDNGEEDVMPPQREFVPKEKANEDEIAVTEIKEEEIPDHLKGEDMEVISADDDFEEDEDEKLEDDGDEDSENDEEDSDDDEEFVQYSIDDMEYEDEEEENTDDDEEFEEEEQDDSYEEDDV